MLFNYIFYSWSLGSSCNTQKVRIWTAGRQLSRPALAHLSSFISTSFCRLSLSFTLQSFLSCSLSFFQPFFHSRFIIFPLFTWFLIPSLPLHHLLFLLSSSLVLTQPKHFFLPILLFISFSLNICFIPLPFLNSCHSVLPVFGALN